MFFAFRQYKYRKIYLISEKVKQSHKQICFFAEYMIIVEKEAKGISLKEWFKKIGIAGFLFFLIKGLVWIAVFIFAGKCSGL